MNYQNIYDQLTSRAKHRKKPDVYCERHHILPKCLGGDNSKSNIALLTAKEHFFAHKLLCKIHPENYKLRFALVCMGSPKGKSAVGHVISSEEYRKIRDDFGEYLRKSSPKRGVPLTHDHKKKLSESSPRLSGVDHPMFGRTHSEESKIKMSTSSKRASGPDHSMFGKKHSKKAISSMRKYHEENAHKRWNYKHEELHLSNELSGDKFTGTRYEFCKAYSISTSSGGLSRFLTGSQGSFKGWKKEESKK